MKTVISKKDVTVSGDFETSQFTLKADPKAFAILSDKIYTDSTRAVIRELSTNAWDAHIEAGTTDTPVDIHLPTRLEAWFCVRDYGTGLSHEDCMTIFTTYFHSTKTDSDDYTGCLGLGSKSPYAVSDSFTVTSFYNGTKRVYTAYKDENDCPQFALISTTDTDEPNGMEVNVPVPEYKVSRFQEKAKIVYQYFNGLVNINDREVQDHVATYWDRYKMKNDRFASSGQYGDVVCVMGGVHYNVSDLDHDLSDSDIVLFFEMGAISFNPGREHLNMDARTRDAIINRLNEVQDKLAEELQKEVDACDTFYDARRLYASFSKRCFGVTKCEWRGKTVRSEPTLTNECKLYRRSSYGSNVEASTTRETFFDDKTEFFWEERGFISRIREHLKGKPYGQEARVVLVSKDAASLHVEEMGICPTQVKDLDTLPKPQRSGNASKRTSCRVFKMRQSYEYATGGSEYWDEAEIEIGGSEEYVYVEICRYEPVGSFGTVGSIVRALNTLGLKVDVYGLKKTIMQTQKFAKAKNMIKLKDWIKRETQFMTASKTPFTDSNSCGNILAEAAKKTVGPTQLSAFARGYHRRDDNAGLADCLAMFHPDNVKKDSSLQDLYDSLCTKYPMITILSPYRTPDMEIVMDYINERDSNA